MQDDSFSSKIEKKIKKGLNDYVIESTDEYNHHTFVVENLADYIRVVSAISSTYSESIYDKSVIFRGIADSQYDLQPGLSRLEKFEEETEKTIIHEFLARRPEAFTGLSEFDMLAKMQHYGLPTRLLDFTLNPLVALYFACESFINKSGRILCHSTYLNSDSSPIIRAICSMAVNKDMDSMRFIEDYLADTGITLLHYLSNVYLYGETIVVKPKYWTSRIANQAGLFMIYPNDLRDKYLLALSHYGEMEQSEVIKEYIHGKCDEKKFIEAVEVEPLLTYKNEHSFLTDEKYKKLYAAYSSVGKDKELNEIFSERFQICPILKPLSEATVKNEFCSIIIPGNKKKGIQKELSRVGISTDYIYPELEYTAKEIRKRFE